VGEDVRQAFIGWRADADACFVPLGTPGQYLADLPALARLRLQALGITQVSGNDGTPPWCTVSQASRFFSHRRDAVRLGSTGRMAACIQLG
jgi:copper oxidase (laccase) domain-containing protein